MLLRKLIQVSLTIGLTASAASVMANPAFSARTASPDSVAATAGVVEGSFSAAMSEKAAHASGYRGANAWWAAGNEAGNKSRSFGQVVSQSQSGDVAVLSVGGSVVAVDPVSPAPEPSTYVLLLGGLALVAFMARRRRAD